MPVRRILLAIFLVLCSVAWTLVRPPEIPFEKHTLDLGANEACAVADVNGDRHPDIISGENWYEGPKWVKHRFREIGFSNNYVDDFSNLPLDVNRDGSPDIVACSWFSRKLVWLENPGKAHGDWREHIIEGGSPIEFAFLVDINNDGEAREVLPQFGDATAPLAWYEVKNSAFLKDVIHPQSGGHGIGAGDVNGDGRTDVLTPQGWFEAPEDPRVGTWIWKPEFDLESLGFLHVLDVNGDDRNDIVTSKAHDYGILWLEQAGDGTWKRHLIDDSWSQAHALTVIDLNGDGRKDLITGKRYMAHNGKDPGEREPLGIYWYEYTVTPGSSRVEWTRHVIDYSSRADGGMQPGLLSST